jgi:hypothetical protein
MSALIFTPSALLEGQRYRSTTRKGHEGVIQYAEIANDIWYGENTTAYRVRVRPDFFKGELMREDFWATVAIRSEA